MPTDAFGAFGSPLIVWLGPRKYTFPAGRDVTVGRGNDVDIRLDGGSTAGAPSQLLLHHNGRQWIAVDRSESGIYVDGVRMSSFSTDASSPRICTEGRSDHLQVPTLWVRRSTLARARLAEYRTRSR